MDEYSEPLSTMQHQLQEALDQHNRDLALAYALQLRNYLNLVIGKLSGEES